MSTKQTKLEVVEWFSLAKPPKHPEFTDTVLAAVNLGTEVIVSAIINDSARWSVTLSADQSAKAAYLYDVTPLK